MNAEVRDLIGGRKGIIRLSGPFIGPNDVTVLNAEDLHAFRPNNDPKENVVALEHLISQTHAKFEIDENTIALLADKTRPYARLYDFMLIFADTKPQDRFIQSINDLTPAQLSKTLEISQQILRIYSDFSKTELLTGISFNFQVSAIDDSKVDPDVKTRSQTFPFAHAHLVAIEVDEIADSNIVNTVKKREFRDIYDPTTHIFERLMEIPSIRSWILKDTTKFDSNFQFFPSGLRFKVHADITDPIVSGELQRIQSKFHQLYDEISNCFVDPNVEDAIGMPTLRPDRQMRAKEFADGLLNMDENYGSEDVIRNLSRELILLSKVIRPADQEDIISGKKPIVMKSFSDTITFYKFPKDHDWCIMISPRIFSTGNMLASLGFMKEKPNESKPADDRWKEERSELVKRIQMLSMRRKV